MEDELREVHDSIVDEEAATASATLEELVDLQHRHHHTTGVQEAPRYPQRTHRAPEASHPWISSVKY